MLTNLSLRFRLALLVAGTALPLILFAGGIVYLHHVRDREVAFDDVLDTVRNMRLVLDSEVQSILAGLQVLASAQSLQRNDLESFSRNAAAFLSRYPPGSNISLADAGGRQVFNTRGVPGTELPPVARDTLAEVFRTGDPAYSNLFRGSVSGDLIIVIDVPVFRDGKAVYSLSFNPPLSIFQRIITQQRQSEDWTMSIFDRNGVNFARVPNPEATIGRFASPTLLPILLNRPEAKIFTRSLEDVPLLTAFTRSPVTGWTVAAGIPVTLVTAPLWRTLAVTAAIGAVLLLIGLAFAVRMATRIARGEALQRLMVNELNHRVKNTLATVQAIASQTFRDSANGPEAKAKFESRLIALGRAHNILSESRWTSADLHQIIDGVFQPHGLKSGPRLALSGPPLQVAPQCALMLSMILHELATNAAKYGALSNDTGKILLDWHAEENVGGPRLNLRWREVGGPPVKPPAIKGFGSRLIEQTVALHVEGAANIQYEDGGVVFTLECPYQ